jgi:2-keto-4-pentenoate hydratase/2-oxohepta-3-ene-1,7-dioic acid hydratase in catechol pathway
MKLVRFGAKGEEKPGVIDEEGRVRDVSSEVADWTGATLDDASLERVRARLDTFGLVDEGVRLGPPVGGVGKIVGCALTYGKHAAEAGLDVPREPMFLLTAATAINGPADDVVMPRDASKLDWEAELGVVLGRGGSYIEEAQALEHVAGFCVSNDVSERVFQLERGTQWTKGKSADTFKPLGPWLVTRDEVGDPNQLDISLSVNGVTMQSSNTSDMVFSIAELIARISHYLSWSPGDVLMTGTPAGVGYGMDPPQYLEPGDVMEARIEKLGAQRSTVRRFDGC